MITIDLLPEEYRSKIRPSLKLQAIGYGFLAAAVSLFAWWAWLAFGVSMSLQTEQASLESELAGLVPQVEYNQSLQAEAAFHAAREDTLATITSSRVLWTQVLDDLTDVVNQGHEDDRHTIWFDDLSAKVEDRVGNEQRSFGLLDAQGHSGSGEIDQISHFLADLTDREISGLSGIFGPPSAPEGRRSPSDPEVVPSVDFSFPLHLDLLPTAEREHGASTPTPEQTENTVEQSQGEAQ